MSVTVGTEAAGHPVCGEPGCGVCAETAAEWDGQVAAMEAAWDELEAG